jgi:rhodanese-related sulfurtransferase
MPLTEAYIALVADAKTRVREIDTTEFQAMTAAGEAFVLVDVREDREWNAGHAKGAIHLGKGIIERDVEACVPDRSATIVLYCGGGFRSALAADNLLKMGYTNPISLAGGWKAWNEAGLPVTREGEPDSR